MSNGAITGSEDQLTQHFQMMQFAGREMFSISVTLKLHFERAGKWKTQMVDPDSCKSSGSACGWPSTSMWSVRSEVRSYMRWFWINTLVPVCLYLCVCTGWDSVRASNMVFFSWRCLLWVSFEKGCDQKENIMHRFICHYFLTKLFYLQQPSGPCVWQWHNNLAKSSQKDDVGLRVPCCQCSVTCYLGLPDPRTKALSVPAHTPKTDCWPFDGLSHLHIHMSGVYAKTP